MSLMKKLFRGDGGKETGTSSVFAESQSAQTSLEKTKSRNAPRRDLVKVVLRECMRRHGIPSDWMDVRTLSVLTKTHKSGMHVQFLVHKGDHQLLQWVHAFQENFWGQIMRMDPTAREWVFSVGWEFYGRSVQGFEVMPDPRTWKKDAPDTTVTGDGPLPREEAGDTLPPDQADEHDALADDLSALQAAMMITDQGADAPDTTPEAQVPQR